MRLAVRVLGAELLVIELGHDPELVELVEADDDTPFGFDTPTT